MSSVAPNGFHNITGFMYFVKGFSLCLKPGLRRYIILPIILNVCFLSLGFWFGLSYSGELTDNLIMEYMPNFSFLSYLVKAIIFLVMLVIMLYSFTTIALIIGSPFYSILSEKTEELLCGHAINDMTMIETIKDIPHMVGLEILKLLYRIPLLILGLIALFIPLIGPILTALIGAWCNAMDYTSYGFENNHVSFKNTRTSIASHKTVCLSFGLAAWVGLLIPFLNLVMIPAAVCGGTLLWHERLKPDFADYINIRRNNNSASKQAPSSSSKSLTSK